MVQPGNRDLNASTEAPVQAGLTSRRDRMIPEPTDRRNNVIGVHGRLMAAEGDGLLNHFHRVFSQQLQDPHVLSRASGQSLPRLQVGPQGVEAGRQFPVGKHEGMIQGRRPATEDRQIMLRLHDPFSAGVTAFMAGDDAGAADHLDPIHVRLEGHRLEGPAARHTVAVRIEPHRLVLIDLRDLRDKGVEGTGRQGQGPVLVLLEQLPDRLRFAGHDLVPLGQSARPQVGVQLRQVLHSGNRRRPVPLQIVHTVFHIGLFIAPRRHAKPGIETVVARQSRVPWLHLALATFQDRRGHRLGIIPPDFPGYAAEKLESLDHPRQDRLGLLARQRHAEPIARMTPRQQQHRNLLAALGEVHIDMAKVRLQPSARRMRQRDKRLALGPTELTDVAPHLVVAAPVAVLIPQTTIQLRRRMPLLAGGLSVLLQDLLDQRLVRTQLRGRPLRRQPVRTRLTLLQNLPDLPPGMMKPSPNFPNAHPIPMRNPDLAIIFHRQHPFFSIIQGPSSKSPQLTEITAVGPFSMPILPSRRGSLLHADFQ